MIPLVSHSSSIFGPFFCFFDSFYLFLKLFFFFFSLCHLTSLALYLRTILVWFVVVVRPRRFLTLFALFTYWPTRSALATPHPSLSHCLLRQHAFVCAHYSCATVRCQLLLLLFDYLGYFSWFSFYSCVCVCQSVCERVCVRECVSLSAFYLATFVWRLMRCDRAYRFAINVKASYNSCYKRQHNATAIKRA